MGFSLDFGYNKEIDYIRVYSTPTTLVLDEDFTNSTVRAWPNPTSLCPIPNCSSEWVKFFQQRTGPYRSLSQIEAEYRLQTGWYEDPCINAPLKLCGVTALPTLPPAKDSACADVELLGIEKGTMAWIKYQDSIRNEFDRLYLAKCMAAAGKETFTMEHRVAEYHYTLYYYDRAGNLVQTVPPAGVLPIYRATYLDSVHMYRKAGNTLVHPHGLVTNYRYNSLNQVVAQHTPDAGRSDFWYDRLGRLVLSRNAKQNAASTKQYSYTLYDALGRITEVGQKQNAAVVSQTLTQNAQALYSFINNQNITFPKTEVTITQYDKIPTINMGAAPAAFTAGQRAYTVRNRVSYTLVYDSYNADVPTWTDYNMATYFNYDIHGNVHQVMHDYRTGALGVFNANRFKFIQYNYDLVSGKVNSVAYNPGYADQFYHRYSYDAENRITDVYTTTHPLFVGNSALEDRDVWYRYYKHGPLSRMVLGQQQVQGIDYAYTLQGWLKGVNGSALNTGIEMGGDIATATDVFGFALNYYSGDYSSIKGTQPFASIPALPLPAGETKAAGKDLYNGNISSMLVNLPKVGTSLLYAYRYDQLNRLVRLDAYSGINHGTNVFTPVSMADYKERIKYDPNGNIETYLRQSTTAGGRQLAMDNLTYKYPQNAAGQITSNRLRYVHDQVATTNYATEDIDTQTALALDTVQKQVSGSIASDNYQYDLIGNLTKDVEEGISNIEWTVYGKIKTITKTNGMVIGYTYDPSGNRIAKAVTQAGTTTTTSYVRDAQGNVMAVYTSTAGNSNSLVLQEQHIYGSSRLGLYTPLINVSSLNTTAVVKLRGSTQYELSNHLGNVLATITDIKKPNANASGNVAYYTANVVSASDFYPFGMQMPGRVFSSGTYRYGFNGQERSPEISDNNFTAEYWQYDSRIGRRWNVDPVIKPWQSDYVTFSNNPVAKIDPKGDDDFFNSDGSFAYRTKTGTNIKVLTQQGAKLLSEIQPNNSSNRRALTNIIAYYAPRAGIPAKTLVGISPSSPSLANSTTNDTDRKPTLAFTNSTGILISAKNGINPKLNNYNNLVNTLVHEEGHLEAGHPKKENLTFSEHVSVYEKQITDKTFSSTDINYKTGTTTSFVGYLLGAVNTGEIDEDEFDRKISSVNSKLKDFGIVIHAQRELGSNELKPIKIFVKGDKGKWKVSSEPVKAQVTPN